MGSGVESLRHGHFVSFLPAVLQLAAADLDFAELAVLVLSG